MKCLLLVLFYSFSRFSRVSVVAGGADVASSRPRVFARTDTWRERDFTPKKSARKNISRASGVTVWCREGRVALFVPSIRSGKVFGRDE